LNEDSLIIILHSPINIYHANSNGLLIC